MPLLPWAHFLSTYQISGRYMDLWASYGDISVCQDSGVHHFVFFCKKRQLTLRLLPGTHFLSTHQISWRYVVLWPSYGDFIVFQDGVVRHFVFFLYQNRQLVRPVLQDGAYVSTCQISSRCLIFWWSYTNFSIFKMGCHHFVFFCMERQITLPLLPGAHLLSILNFMKICRFLTELWPLYCFTRWRTPPFCFFLLIIGIWHIRYFQMANICPCVKFCAYISIFGGVTAIFLLHLFVFQ